MTKEEQEEYDKCKNDPYYFFINYHTVDGEKLDITREQFESITELLGGQLIKLRKGPTIIIGKK